MSIRQILREPSVRAALPRRNWLDTMFARDWVRRRLNRLIADGKAKPEDISGPTDPKVIEQIAQDLALVPPAHREIQRRIAADPHHMSFATRAARESIRRQVASGNMGFGNDPRRFRDHTIRSIVYQACAADIGWITLDPTLDRLHRLTDRRLRIVEVMAHQVGSRPPGISPAAWNSRRMFEYPADIQGVKVNPSAEACWRKPPNLDPPKHYPEVDFTPYPDRCTCTAAEAIRQLFTPYDDESQRNHLFCDHVMMALHLEALEFVMRSRNKPPGWLDDEWRAQPQGVRERWLRIHNQFGNQDTFLGARHEQHTGESHHFLHTSVPSSDLQVGDHVIVYNHPLYRYFLTGAMRLENCVVMQTVPGQFVQGHGSRAYLLDDMRLWLLNSTNAVLTLAEQALAERKRSGQLIELPPELGLPRLPAYFYKDGPRGRIWFVRKFDPDRFPEYAGDGELAAWYLVWECDIDEMAIVNNPQRRAHVLQKQYVEFTVATQPDGKPYPIAWFPMALLDSQTLDVMPVLLAPANVYGWDMYADTVEPGRELVPVIRPGE